MLDTFLSFGAVAASGGSALLSFLGGSAFRMAWGEISAYFTRRQEHQQEVERMKLQGDLDAAAHSRQMEAIQLQAGLKVKEIRVQRDADLARIETGAWATLVEGTTKLTGIKFLDIWNGSIRPALATMAMAMVAAEVIKRGFALTEWDRDLIAAILGIYLADRQLMKRGK